MRAEAAWLAVLRRAGWAVGAAWYRELRREGGEEPRQGG
jgi:hypothetical protein